MPMLSPGSRIGDYQLVRYAATGATSEVYEGAHLQSGQRVAVKVLHPELCRHQELVQRFLNEGHTLQQLHHVHIVSALAYGLLPEGPPYMVLEWLPMDLHRTLSGLASPLPPRAALRIISQLSNALESLHERGIIHRDLKPSNVLLPHAQLDSLDVKLADLGLAKVLPDDPLGTTRPGQPTQPLLPVSTANGALLGTWEYMAPEQWIHPKHVDTKADVYALGVLSFQLLTGRLPFIAEQQQDLMYFHLMTAPPVELLLGIVPETACALISAMLDKRPAPRPTAHDLTKSLSQLVS